MDKPHRRPSKFSKTSTPSPIPSAHVRLAAEYWLEVFTDRLLQITNDESSNSGARYHTHENWTKDAVQDAHTVADAALEAYERRWPGVKLP